MVHPCTYAAFTVGGLTACTLVKAKPAVMVSGSADVVLPVARTRALCLHSTGHNMLCSVPKGQPNADAAPEAAWVGNCPQH